MKLLKNHLGEYNYHFSWKDEDGFNCGFNDVWAKNKNEAIKKAKEMESPGKTIYYDIINSEGKVERSSEWFKGMYLDESTLRKVTGHQRDEVDRIGWLMTH
tara:strand:+ start:306 stop:608 length:303 start_codon:yes stop_codon:yes gene_type:complete